jgi:cyclopropane-fatty-acyl-phospholipid synthase
MSLGLAARRGIWRALERVEGGVLTVTAPDGETLRFGRGAPAADITIRDWRIVPAVLAHGDIGFGEAYVAGWWDSSDVERLVAFGVRNSAVLESALSGSPWSKRAFALLDALLRDNSRKGSRRNIHAHYDLGNDFYSLWLDESMTYSSALFADASESLERAQMRKYDRLLDSADGARTLEIGCGWGGFAERAADKGRDVTAITISQAQHTFASARLGGRAEVRLQDYRDVTGVFDAIVSVEMAEAVGERHWPAYFATIKQRLAKGGRAAIQAIVVEDDYFPVYRTRSDYIRRHVFPGGMLLAPGRIREEAERAGLEAHNLFRFGRDYARTLRHWLERFNAAEEAIRALGYSERFMRSWRFYLTSCAALFEARQTDVVQVELRHA